MDGFININKDHGDSSQRAVAVLRRLLAAKAGHCGTLDPAATGVLPVCLGKATRLSQYVMGREKRYIGEITFGQTRDSYDGDGAVVAETDASWLTAADIEALLPRFRGDILQKPPLVSALKRDGEPLYKKARRGEQVELAARPVVIYDLKLLDFSPSSPYPRCRLEIACGQGAYIRSIAHDLGQLLGCGAYLSALCRTQVGAFRLEDSYTLEQVAELAAQGREDFLIPMDQALSHLPALTAADDLLPRLAHGNPVAMAAPDQPLLRIRDGQGRLIGLGRVERGRLLMDKVLVEAEDYPAPPLTACAIGNFDGLHLGHRALFDQLRQRQRELGGQTAVLTFSPHPLAVISGRPPALLSGEEMKRDLLTTCFGVDRVLVLPFDQELRRSTPQQFVDRVIVERLGVKEIVVGYNFSYADQGAGTPQLLRQQCAERGVRVTVVDQVSGDYGPVSSSGIRHYLQAGDLEAVNAMLGYWFAMEGQVVYGNQMGRSVFGFPTANIYPDEGLALPVNGVYAGRIQYLDQTYDGVINFGVKPTIGGERRPLIEANLFDVDLDLYGQTLRVFFGQYLRPEQRFASHAQLKARIEADSRLAREYLAGLPANFHLPKQLD